MPLRDQGEFRRRIRGSSRIIHLVAGPSRLTEFEKSEDGVATAAVDLAGADAVTDVARHVGHSNPATTAGYVKSLGHRPAATARRAAELLDPTVAAD